MATYDPIDANVAPLSPARRHMLTFLTRWMQAYMIDGIRIDSVENVANWDFIQEFKDLARKLYGERYPAQGTAADAKMLVVGEELTLPSELITQGRLDGLWNERFQGLVRAALIGENVNGLDFVNTVHRAIDCRIEKVFTDGAQAINYLTSHDVEGPRKERLYNLMASVVPLANSNPLFDRPAIEAEQRAAYRQEHGTPANDQDQHDEDTEVTRRTDNLILHKARLRRVKLGFVCQMTAVGIPMILAGEEFGDEHDLFDRWGHVSQDGGKQVDPVSFQRLNDPDRRDVFDYVCRLVKLRTTHPALARKDTSFFQDDCLDGKQVIVWRRGQDADPIVVVANFSDYTTPNALQPGAEYFVPGWPATPSGMHWFEVTTGRDVPPGLHDREPIFAWEAKVYRLVPDRP